MTGWDDAVDILGDALAGTAPAPGGGAAAGAAGVMGCALGQMAAGISARSKKIDGARRDALLASRERLGAFRSELQVLVREDAAAFSAVMAAYALPKTDEKRARAIESTLRRAAEVPLETARRCAAALDEVRTIAGKAAGTVRSDMRCAEHLLQAGILSALENVEINISLIKDEAVSGSLRTAADQLRSAVA